MCFIMQKFMERDVHDLHLQYYNMRVYDNENLQQPYFKTM